MTLPLTPLAHQFAWTAPVAPPVRPAHRGGAADPAPPGPRPLLPRALRHDRHRLLRPPADAGGRVPPEIVQPRRAGRRSCRRCWPFTPDDFDEALEADPGAAAGTRDADDRAASINGIFSFTTDNMPLLGPNRLTCEGSGSPRRCGSRTRPGSARAMAEWLVDGHCRSFDLHECDVNRFEPHQLAPDYVRGPRLPELRRGLRHHPSAAAAGESAADADLAVLRAAARPRRGVPRGQRLGTAAVVRGQRRAGRRGPLARAPTPDDWAARTGRRSSPPRRRPPANRSRCTT